MESIERTAPNAPNEPGARNPHNGWQAQQNGESKMTNATETKITVQKTDAGWTASNVPGVTFHTRDAARKASKDPDAFAVADTSTVIADGALIAVEGSTWQESPAPAATVATVADPALAAANARIAELTAKLEAATATAAVANVAEEVIVITPAGHSLPDARRRRTVYEADAEGIARFHSAANQAGERVTYAPFAWGGEAHMAIANALSAAGFVAGDSLEVDDLACVPGRSATQARWGSKASRATARHRMTNAGMLSREAGGRRGVSYTLAEDFFTPEAWPIRAAQALADLASVPVPTNA